MNLIPLPAAARGDASHRLMPVAGDAMAPTLRHGDFVLVRPTDRFEFDGLYAVDLGGGEAEIARCSATPYGTVALLRDNPDYHPLSLPRADFDKHVLAIVCWTLHQVAG